MSDSVWPLRWQPTRLCRPWDSPGKNSGVGCHFLLQCMKVKSESEVAQSCLALSYPMHCRHPGSSVHRISRQEYWSWVSLPSQQWRHSAQRKKKKKNNQWGLMESRTWKRMKQVWIWYHASHGEGSCSLFSQEIGTYVVPQTCPNPRLGSLDFTLQLKPSSHPSTNT